MKIFSLFISITILLFLGCSKSNSNNRNSNINACGTVTDIDGNVYNTVQIGNQCWMVENLRTTRFRNGDLIGEVRDSVAWFNCIKYPDSTGVPAWCYFNNDPRNDVIYGKLYNVYNVIDRRNIAPVGWHVPAISEWETLTDNLGGWTVAGKEAKATILWSSSPGVINTNSSGFTGLPSGGRVNVGFNGSVGISEFRGLGNVGKWWSTTPIGGTLNGNKGASLNNISDSFFKDEWLGTGNGFSIRCVKD